MIDPRSSGTIGNQGIFVTVSSTDEQALRQVLDMAVQFEDACEISKR